MTDVVPLEPLPANDTEAQRWQEGLHLVGQWLIEYSGNSRATYADAIGWPYTAAGEPRGYHAVRHGVGLLGWCYARGIHLFDMNRVTALAWVDALNASRHPETGELLSKRSKALAVSAASSFYRWAIFAGHTEVNPIDMVDRKKKGLNTSKDKSPTRSLSKAEAHAMLVAADNDPVESVRLRTAAIIALILEVGPRVSEGVCKATLADMYVQDGRRVLHTVLKGGRDHEFALPPAVCRRIDAYLLSRKDVEKLPARRGDVSRSTTPLFATATGKPLHRSEVWTLVRRIAELSGIDHPESVHPHVGRHTYATEARRQGRSNEDLKDAFGHAFSSTSARYGQHIISLENSPAYGVAEAFEAGNGTAFDHDQEDQQ